MTGKKYLLLGASSSVALAFLSQHAWKQGDEVIAQYCGHKDALEKMEEKIPAKLFSLQSDFLSEKSTLDFIGSLRERGFVPTHILHIPALPIVNARFTEISWKDVQAQIDVQSRSFFYVMQAVVKEMAKAREGKIVVVLSSVTCGIPPRFLSGYVMSKYALMGLTKSLASEYAPKGIQFNMVSPSMMETKFVANVHDTVIEQSARANPSQRNACPEDVAGLVSYLFSDANTFITGTNIPVTGGEIF